MPRATVEPQNVTPADQQQRTDFRAWNAQQPKLIEGNVDELPKLIEAPVAEQPKSLVQTGLNVPLPKEAAVPTKLTTPQVKDDVREWERTQGVVAGADAQAQAAEVNNNELLAALPTHVMSPTPLKSRNETFQDREKPYEQDEHHGLKDRIVGVAEGVKDRVEGIWEGAKHRGEDLKDKALNVLHLRHNEQRQELPENTKEGMISDAEAVRIGKQFDISDDKDTLIESEHHVLSDVKSFVSHKWHEFTHAPEVEERESSYRTTEFPEWTETKQEMEHIDDAELRQSIMTRQFFEQRRNLQLPESPREEPKLFRNTTSPIPAREVVVVERFDEPTRAERMRAEFTDGARPLFAPERVHRGTDPHRTSSEIYARTLGLRNTEAEEKEIRRRENEGIFGGVRHFVHDKWDALVHQEPERVRLGAELNSKNVEIRNPEEVEILRLRDSSPRQTLYRAETDTKKAFQNARDDVKEGWHDVKENARDAKDWTKTKAKAGIHDVKEWTKDAVDSAGDTAERFWNKAENAAERTVAGVEHALGADLNGPDIVQRLEMMDQENILDIESDRRVYGRAAGDFPERYESGSWWSRREREGRNVPLFGSATPEKFDIHFARPVVEERNVKANVDVLRERQNYDLRRDYAKQTGFVEKPVEQKLEAEKRWFWRSRSPTQQQRFSDDNRMTLTDRLGHRLEDVEANTVEDIMAGAPVQRISREYSDSLHQNKAYEEIPIRDTRLNFNENEIRVERPGMLQSMRDFVSDKWTSFTGHPTTFVEEKTSPQRGLNRFDRFENKIADRVERYEENQIREAQKDWADGKTGQYHSHASRAHAAENIAEKLRGTDEKENRSPTTPITPGYPV